MMSGHIFSHTLIWNTIPELTCECSSTSHHTDEICSCHASQLYRVMLVDTSEWLARISFQGEIGRDKDKFMYHFLYLQKRYMYYSWEQFFRSAFSVMVHADFICIKSDETLNLLHFGSVHACSVHATDSYIKIINM